MIYAINKRTKEHRVVPLDDRIGSWMPEWETVGADAEGWIPWEGGECPLPDGTRCEYKMRLAGRAKTVRGSEYLDWSHEGGSAEIVAYRPILEADEPAAVSEPEAVEWDGEGPCRIGYRVHCIASPSHEVFEVIHWADGMAWLRDVDSGRHELYLCDDIRPLRTPAQRAEDEAVEDMMKVGEGVTRSRQFCRALYHAIRAGKVPGVKLDNN